MNHHHMEVSTILGRSIVETPEDTTEGKNYINETVIPLCRRNCAASTDTDEAGPNDVQDKMDTYCTILTLCLVMEHDGTPIERNTVSMISLPQRGNAERKLNNTKYSIIP